MQKTSLRIIVCDRTVCRFRGTLNDYRNPYTGEPTRRSFVPFRCPACGEGYTPDSGPFRRAGIRKVILGA